MNLSRDGMRLWRAILRRRRRNRPCRAGTHRNRWRNWQCQTGGGPCRSAGQCVGGDAGFGRAGIVFSDVAKGARGGVMITVGFGAARRLQQRAHVDVGGLGHFGTTALPANGTGLVPDGSH